MWGTSPHEQEVGFPASPADGRCAPPVNMARTEAAHHTAISTQDTHMAGIQKVFTHKLLKWDKYVALCN